MSLGNRRTGNLRQLEHLAIIDVNLSERINDELSKMKRDSWKGMLIETLKNGPSVVPKVLKWKVVHIRWIAYHEPGGCRRQDTEVVEAEELEVCKDS